MYRSTEQPIDHSSHAKQTVDYFCTHAPYEWLKNEHTRKLFERTYGAAALEIATRQGLVPENTNPVWVGGTYWNDPDRRVRPVYGEPETVINVGSFIPLTGSAVDQTLEIVKDLQTKVNTILSLLQSK